MNSQSDTFVANASQLSDIVKDWIDSAIESGTRNAQEWLKQKLQENIPNLDFDTAQSLASDISDYEERISAFREDLAQAASSGMSRQEWFYRKLKDIAGKSTDEAFGQIVGAMGNGFLSQFEKTANEMASQNSDGKKIAQVTIAPDVGPPKFGWNPESIKDRVFDISKVLTALTIHGLSKIGDNNIADDKATPLAHPEQFKESLLKGDKSKFVMAVTGALKEGFVKKALNVPALQNQAPFLPTTDSRSKFNIEIPTFINIAFLAVEFVRQCLSGETQPEKVIEGMIDSTTSTVAGIADVVLSKYGPVLGNLAGTFLESLLGSICPFAPVICKILFPILGKVLLPILGKKIADFAANVIISKVGNMAKVFTHTIFNTLFSKGTALSGIKSVVSIIRSAISGASTTGPIVIDLFRKVFH